MERQLKQRVVGAALLVAFGVIFIPIFLDNGSLDTTVPPNVDIPPAPIERDNTALPLDETTIDALERRIDAAPELPTDGASAATTPADAIEPAGVVPPAPAAVAPELPTAAAVATPSAAPVASAPTSGWAIQLGSFASEENARRLLDKLHAAGYTAYLERQREGNATVFKVRAGPERERRDAERLRQRLEREFATKGILRPYP